MKLSEFFVNNVKLFATGCNSVQPNETSCNPLQPSLWDYEINFAVSEEVTISGIANDGYILDGVVVINENGETIAPSNVLPITVVANADYKIISVPLHTVVVHAGLQR